MNLRIIGERILVQAPGDAPETTATGLIVPQSAQPDVVEVLVVATGPGRLLESGEYYATDVDEGETVLINKHAGVRITRGDREFRLLTPHEILAVVEE